MTKRRFSCDARKDIEIASSTLPLYNVDPTVRNISSPGASQVLNRKAGKNTREPTRTTKTAQKGIDFPPDENLLLSGTSTETDGEFKAEDIPFGSDILLKDDKAIPKKRVTGYCVADGIKLRELKDHVIMSLKKKQNSSSILHGSPVRYDEVLFVCYKPSTSKFSKYPHTYYLHTCTDGHESPSSSWFREIFYFDYGVIVTWGFTEDEESIILEEAAPFFIDKLPKVDIEIEELEYCINPQKPARLFNDIINLKNGNHMLKLTISHAIAQSVKLSYFEEEIEEAINETKHIPANMADSGSVQMSRSTINKLIGRLFVMRINVNLVSNVLDTPEIFWAEPGLNPLYKAVRAYLEISQRVEVLNDRTLVITDLLNILKDHINNSHGETLEWIVIILIVFEAFIGIAEICIEIYH